jgi:hypothetical protein
MVHIYSGFRISVWRSGKRNPSPPLSLALTPPSPSGSGGEGALQALRSRMSRRHLRSMTELPGATANGLLKLLGGSSSEP